MELWLITLSMALFVCAIVMGFVSSDSWKNTFISSGLTLSGVAVFCVVLLCY